MSQSDYTIREAYEADLPEIADLFRRHNYGPKDINWLRWKYLENPDGVARMYVAEDVSGAIVGFQAFLPRKFMSAKTGDFSVLHNVDVFVTAELRKAGIYSKLSKYCGTNLTDPRISFPNRLSLPFGLRNGYQILAPIDVWFFPVAIGQLFRGTPYGFIAGVTDALSRLYAALWTGRIRRNICIRPLKAFHKGAHVDSSVIHGIRSADYLNWRFIKNPMCDFSVYEFLSNDESIGYCAYTISDGTAEVFDLVAEREKRACLRHFIEHCREGGISRLMFPGVGLRLGRLGFIRRGSSGTCTTRDVPEGDWMITLCDRDV